jgi:hypothetical protein
MDKFGHETLSLPPNKIFLFAGPLDYQQSSSKWTLLRWRFFVLVAKIRMKKHICHFCHPQKGSKIPRGLN